MTQEKGTPLSRFLKAQQELKETLGPNEATFTWIRPEAVAKGLVGKILQRFEDKDLTIKALKVITVDRESAERFNVEHKGKPFFDEIVSHMTSGPSVMVVISGPRAIDVVRKMIGKVNPADADPGTIRGDFALGTELNLVYVSDHPKTVKQEIELFFPDQAKQLLSSIDPRSSA